ncbi:MAG: hypothetical protein KC731_07140 [Myxococcales bacterium]|nr:hypothetical protein [Myxococcales bacterium]
MARLALLVALLLALCTARPAVAQPSATELDAARALANAGLGLYQKGDYAQSLERFREAERIFHAPPHQLFIARNLDKLGRVVEATKAYDALIGEALPATAPKPFRQAQQEAVGEVEAVRARIAHLVIQLQSPSGAEPSVTLRLGQATVVPGDNEVDPGDYVLEMSGAGIEPLSQEVHLEPGGRDAVALTVVVVEDGGGPETPDESPSLVGPAVLLGVGGAGLLVGAITGLLALGAEATLEENCPDRTRCPLENQRFEDRARTLGNASTATFIIGGAAASAGLVWLVVALTTGDEEPELVEGLSLQPDGLLLRF